MSAAENYGAVLTREELSALLESGPAPEARPIGMVDPGPARAELTTIAERFADDLSRVLSTLHQTPLHFRFSHWEEITLRQFASAMMQTDRIACLDVARGGTDVYLLMSRPLVFGWMVMAFGAQPGSGDPLIPQRPYTRIEERFLTRAATEVTHSLTRALGGNAEDGRVVALAHPVSLYDRTKRPYLVASFEVSGLGDFCGIRLALPASLLEDGSSETVNVPVEPSGHVADHLLDTPIDLRVQIGFTEISLSQMATLQPGSELRLRRSTEGGLQVMVEDLPKFEAEPGSIGGKLAIRITEVLGHE